MFNRIFIPIVALAFYLILTGQSPVNADSPPAPGMLYLPIIGRGIALHDYVSLVTSTYDGDSEIFTLRGDGSDLQRLTNNDVADEQPQWSPDKSQILWVQFSGLFPNKSYDDLWIMNSDGTNARPLTQHTGLERGSWSPSGQHIFYYNRADTGDIYTAYSLYTITPSGDPTLIQGNTYLTSYTWSPDGTHLLLALLRRTNANVVNDLYTVKADGSELTLIAQNIRTAQWSPTSDWLAFDAVRDGDENVYLARPDGSTIQPITNDALQDRLAGWVEGGERLLLKRTEADWGLGRYYLIDAVMGATPTPFILGGPTDDFINIEGIAPDGNAVVYSTVTNQGYLYLDWQAIDSNSSTRISPANCASGCGVSNVGWSADGKSLAYAFWQQPVPRIYQRQVYLVQQDVTTWRYQLLDDSALNPVWLPDGYHLALDAAPADGDASVRVPHIANSRNRTLQRVPFLDDADFTTIEWQYRP